jgi:phosphatidate cytidylyltransferase
MRQTLSDTTWGDFPRRLLTIAVGAPLLIGAMAFGAPYFDAVMLVVGGLVLVEFVRMARPTHQVALPLAFGAAALFVFTIAYAPAYFGWGGAGVLLLAGLAWLAVGRSPLALRDSVLYPLLGTVYVIVPIALLIALRGTEEGRLWVSLLAWVTWFTDSWALIGGRLVGRTRLAPTISPGKTVEGALVGIAFGVGAGTVILLVVGKGLVAGLLLSLLVGLATVAGDLFESFLKRHFQVKDASGLLPGHGGFLDRMDSFLVSTPIYCLILVAFSLV